MKTLQLISLLLVMGLSYGCASPNPIDEQEPEPESESELEPEFNGVGAVYSSYHLYMNIRDTSGADKVKGIPVRQSPYIQDTSVIALIGWIDPPDLYQCSVIPAYLRDPYDRSYQLDVDTLWNGHYCLSIGEVAKHYPTSWEEVIIHKLIFPYIFGDDAEHIITTWWKLTIIGPLYSSLDCYRMTLDGKEFPVTQEKKYDHEYALTYSVAWVVLDI